MVTYRMTRRLRRKADGGLPIPCYGIVGKAQGDKKQINAISCDVGFVRRLCNLLKQYQVEPAQMQYVIEDELWKKEQVPFRS